LIEKPTLVAGRKLPSEVADLLASTDPTAQEAAWERFVEQYSRLFLHTIHGVLRRPQGDHDQVMNCYAYVLDQLRRDDFRRLRTFDPHGRGKFTTWIVFVVRRLCVDCGRALYGRATLSRADETSASVEHAARRRLTDLIGEELDLSHTKDPSVADPELEVRKAELSEALETAVGHLPGREQLLLKLRFQDELTGKEIARVVGLATPFHVYRKLNSVFRDLRVELRGNGVGSPMP
jgi:RNA polymerase sigma factor (sigma-70 family)